MKSEKAMEYIGQHDWPDENTNIRSIYCYHVQDAIEIAEQEAEERMRDELTRWHDPKEELPEIKRTIAVKLKSDKGYNVQAGRYEGNEWRFSLNGHTIPATLIIGWREIHD